MLIYGSRAAKKWQIVPLPQNPPTWQTNNKANNNQIYTKAIYFSPYVDIQMNDGKTHLTDETVSRYFCFAQKSSAVYPSCLYDGMCTIHLRIKMLQSFSFNITMLRIMANTDNACICVLIMYHNLKNYVGK